VGRGDPSKRSRTRRCSGSIGSTIATPSRRSTRSPPAEVGNTTKPCFTIRKWQPDLNEMAPGKPRGIQMASDEPTITPRRPSVSGCSRATSCSTARPSCGRPMCGWSSAKWRKMNEKSRSVDRRCTRSMHSRTVGRSFARRSSFLFRNGAPDRRKQRTPMYLKYHISEFRAVCRSPERA